MFYGIKEDVDAENCGELVKTFCADILHVDNAHNLITKRKPDAGKKVKFVGNKLFIYGSEYKPPAPAPMDAS